MLHRRFLTAISLLLLSGVCRPVMAASYKLVGLGIGEASAINNLGHVVGTLAATTPALETHGFIYDGTNVSVLTSTNRYKYATNPATGQALYLDELLATADGINDSDHISGSARYYPQSTHLPYLKIGNSVTHPYEVKDPFYDCTRAVLNNHDVVVATSSFFSGVDFLFHWSYAINDSNVVGGASAEIISGSSGSPKLTPRAALSRIGANGLLHPSLYQPASWDVQFLEPQPAPNGNLLGDHGPIQHLSSVLGINQAGHAVGHRRFGLTHRAFFYKDKAAGIEDLKPLAGDDSSAFGINAKDEVVGTAVSGLGAFHAVLWRDGTPLDLNDVIPPGSGWVLVKASAINDRGDIVGSGTYQGATQAFLLSNVSGDSAPRLTGRNYFGITVEGTVGATYRIEYRVSVSPEQWKPLTTLTLTSPSQFYLDAESAGIPQRLYRAVQQP